ncbi:MAG TPA: hypothetical protein VNF73_13925 [Candidatus Saccharimonadales bacterium]|nr:hypothetical protein [Candidatus Saccharimonadales bacterium]
MTQEPAESQHPEPVLPTADEVIGSARDLSGVERPELPPDPAASGPTASSPSPYAAADLRTVHAPVAIEAASIPSASATTGHGSAAAGGRGSGGVGRGAAAAGVHADVHEAGHSPAAGDGDAHGAHDPRDTNLGPPDLASWSAGVLGVLIALLVALCFALASGVLSA